MSTSLKGHTWGKIDFSETSLKLQTMDENPKSVFSVNFESINNATINKSDIIIETGAEIQEEEDCMCEIRFYVDMPKNEENQMEEDDSNKDANGKQEEDEQQKKQKSNYCSELYKKIIEKAKIGTFAGESILTLNQVNLAVPRGKYTIDYYQKNLRFHGQTYNFTIDYKNIIKGFVLPMENQSQVSIILQLHKDKPIYQGQTLYRSIVLQIKKDISVDIKTRVKDKDKEKNPNLVNIKESYSGLLFQILMELVRTTSGISWIIPNLKDFKSKNGQSCVKCGVKASPGWLYFLNKSLVFIPKPVLYFKIEEIKKVQFNRLGANNKQFDMKVTINDEKKAVEFMNIERNELQILVEYFKSKNVRVEMEEDAQKKPELVGGEDDDDQEDDGDFDGEGMSDDDDDSFDEDESLSGVSENKKDKKDKKDKKNNAQEKVEEQNNN